MAITSTHYELFRRLPLSRGGTLLEIGEANWYGDIDPRRIYKDYPNAMRAVENAIETRNLFNVAKAYYAAVFAPSKNVAIDLNGTPSAVRHDLNTPMQDWIWCCGSIRKGSQCPCCGKEKEPVPEILFDVVINHGTAEHIFNVAQVFRTMHDYCAVGGLMIHDSPCTGWLDHGFYCLQPTLFFDVAEANGYELVMMAAHDYKTGEMVRIEAPDMIGHLPAESMLFVCFRKLLDQPFKVPFQRLYRMAPKGEAA